jgi:hypothetical protein
MKNKINNKIGVLIALLFSIIMFAFQTQAQFDDDGGPPLQEYIAVKFTRTDGTVWSIQATAPYPENPSYLGQTNAYSGLNGIGSHTNLYQGSYYTIDTAGNHLLKDNSSVGQLLWNTIGTNYVVVDVGTHYGFTVDSHGRGWLLSPENDGDNVFYLWRVDITTGECFYIDHISAFNDPENLFLINGAVMITPYYIP